MIYMVMTYMQSKKMSPRKAQLLKICKEEEYSILFYDTSQDKLAKEKNGNYKYHLTCDRFCYIIH